MKNKPTVVEIYFFVLISMLCALLEGSLRWGKTTSALTRLLAFSPFLAIGTYSFITINILLMLTVSVAISAAIIVTTAKDKLGKYLSGKLQRLMLKLEDSVRQAVQVVSNLPHIEKIRLSEVDFTSAILPIAPPPPRAHLAG